MNNLIYKKDAIKVINDEITIEGIVTHYEAMRDAVHQARKIYNKRLEELPPAETQPITCDGCKHISTYDTDFPCSSCIRREKDYYEPEK